MVSTGGSIPITFSRGWNLIASTYLQFCGIFWTHRFSGCFIINTDQIEKYEHRCSVTSSGPITERPRMRQFDAWKPDGQSSILVQSSNYKFPHQTCLYFTDATHKWLKPHALGLFKPNLPQSAFPESTMYSVPMTVRTSHPQSLPQKRTGYYRTSLGVALGKCIYFTHDTCLLSRDKQHVVNGGSTVTKWQGNRRHLTVLLMA